MRPTGDEVSGNGEENREDSEDDECCVHGFLSVQVDPGHLLLDGDRAIRMLGEGCGFLRDVDVFLPHSANDGGSKFSHPKVGLLWTWVGLPNKVTQGVYPIPVVVVEGLHWLSFREGGSGQNQL